MLTAKDWTSTSPWIDDHSIDIQKYLSDRGLSYSNADLEDLYFWRTNGYLILRNAIDYDLIDQYLIDIEWAMANKNETDYEVEVRGLQTTLSKISNSDLLLDGTKLNCLHSYSKAAIYLSLSEPIQRFLYHIFQEDAAPLQSLTFWRGSSQRAHIDYPYVRTQTKIAQLAASWIALEDVTPDAGPLVYYPGSHRIENSGFFDWGRGSILLEPDSGQSPTEFSGYLEARMREVGITPQTFLPQKGDALIWHGNLIHGGAPVESPTATRKSYVTHYTSRSAYPAGYGPANPIEGVNMFSAKPGVCWEFPWHSGKPKLPSWRTLEMYPNRS